MEISERVAEILLNINAVKIAPAEGPFFDYSAKPLQGPTYIDCRMVVSHDLLKQELAELMKQQVGFGVSAVFGSTTAGMSPAENLSRVLGPETNYFYVRTDEKNYGLGKRIEGDKALMNGKDSITYVIAEDLINNGKNLAIVDEAITEWLESIGISVDRKILTAFVTYDKPEVNDWIAGAGYENNILTTVKQVIKLGPSLGRLTQEQSDSALDYLADPTAWREARGLPTKPY